MMSWGGSWRWVPIREVLSYVDERVELDDMMEYITITVKRRHGGLEARERLFGHQIRTKKQLRLIPGAFIVSRVQCWHQAYALVPSDVPSNMIASSNYDQFVLAQDVDARFFWWLSHSPEFTETVRGSASGVVIEKMVFDREKWLDQTVPLPPLEEQRRIVAKIDRLAAKIGEARGLRSKAAHEAKSLLISSRNESFRGLADITKSTRLDNVAECRLGKMLSRNLSDGESGVPYVRNANIQWDRLDLASIYRMDVSDEDRDKYALQAGDILVCEGGDIGKAAIWNDEIPGCIYQKALHRIRGSRSVVEPRFMLYHLFWAADQGHFSDIKTQTTIAHLTGVKLKAYQVYVPVLEEQRRTVAYLDGLQTKVDRVKALQAQTAAELDALLPSILDKAFKGEL